MKKWMPRWILMCLVASAAFAAYAVVAREQGRTGERPAGDSYECRYPGCNCPEYAGGGYLCDRCKHGNSWHLGAGK